MCALRVISPPHQAGVNRLNLTLVKYLENDVVLTLWVTGWGDGMSEKLSKNPDKKDFANILASCNCLHVESLEETQVQHAPRFRSPLTRR